LIVDVETLDSTQVRLKIEVPAEDVDEKLQEAYQVLRSYVSLPGFRKGRAPLAIIKSRFPDHINSEVVSQLVLPAFEDALIDEELIPLDQPTFDPPLQEMKVTENQPFVFSVIVNVKPDIILPDYEEIVIDKTAVNVPREDVEAHIKRLQTQSATYEPIEEDRTVEATDCVRVDWICTIDGEELDSESTLDIDIDLMSEEIHHDLVAGIIGMCVGDTKSIEINFDAAHPVAALAGKTVSYDVSLHAITLKHLPALDDEFAKDLGYETYNQMHGVIWNTMVENERILHVERQKNELLEQLIEMIDIKIPDELIDKHVQQTLENVQKQLMAEQKTPEEAGINMETYPSELRENVIKQTKQNWIFAEISDMESIFVTEDELEWQILRAARQSNQDVHKYADLLRTNNRMEDFRIGLQHEKIYDFLIEQSSEKKSIIITG
jgi:trigger factor